LANESPLLVVNNLVTGYGKRLVVKDASLDVFPGEIVTLIGHNGAGKSTLLKSIFGLLPIWEGTILFGGVDISGRRTRELLHLGMAYLPQGNRVFTELTVWENIEIGTVTLPDRNQLEERMEQVLCMFPLLKARSQQRAGTLSGGEKQMLALARALILSPRLLLLDEPSLGLAPSLVSVAFNHIREICSESGIAVLIVEQKVKQILEVARRVYVMRNGLISFSGFAGELRDDKRLREVYL